MSFVHVMSGMTVLCEERGYSLSRIISSPHPLVCMCVHHLLQPTGAAHQSWTIPTPPLCSATSNFCLIPESGPALLFAFFSPYSCCSHSSFISLFLLPPPPLSDGEAQSKSLLFAACSPFGVRKVISFLSSHSTTSAAVIICGAK